MNKKGPCLNELIRIREELKRTFNKLKGMISICQTGEGLNVNDLRTQKGMLKLEGFVGQCQMWFGCVSPNVYLIYIFR
jgi:hypothetical protein